MRFLVVFILFSIGVWASAQKISRTEYITTYSKLAQKEMLRTGIPASITLAQGLLESGDGNSRLAVKANNHFGIKCHDWTGAKIYHNDDAENECFRKYKSAEDSYRDHSDFLTTKKRYAKLFTLKPDDYKAWAHGLKEAGYATSPTYAKALITIIEENKLYEYDNEILKGEPKKGGNRKKKDDSESIGKNRKLMYSNRVKYVLADSGDTYTSISEELNLQLWQLPKYNERPVDHTLQHGDIVYLQPKRSKAEMGQNSHVVAEGETLYLISQKYAINESVLREKNNIQQGMEPKTGTVLLLRKKAKNSDSNKKVEVKKQTPQPEKKKPVEEEKKEKKVVESDEFQIDIEL